MIICSNAEMLDLLAKAIYLQYPASQLYFAQKIEVVFTKLEQHHPDIIILIPKEPDWDVTSLISKILSLECRCAIILILQNSNEKNVSEFIDLGVKDILTLPINLELLLCRLAGLICLHKQ